MGLLSGYRDKDGGEELTTATAVSFMELLENANEVAEELGLGPVALILGVQRYTDFYHQMFAERTDLTKPKTDGFTVGGYKVVPDARIMEDFALVPESRIRSKL
jgi:hypothetical protein